MVIVACRRCGNTLEGVPGARTVCASCGAVSVLPAQVAPPVRRSTGAGHFTPVVPEAAPMAPPMPAVEYTGPPSMSVPSLLAFIFGLLPWLVGIPTFMVGQDLTVMSGFGAVLGWIGLPLGIAAIVLGVIGLKQVNREPRRYKGRGFAIAGLTLGIVFTAMWVVAVIILVVFCLAYIAAYGNSTAMAAPCPALALQNATASKPVKRKAQLRLLLAHHPECEAFRHDVLNVVGLRLCASCFAFAGAATVASFCLFFVTPSPSAAAWLALGGTLLILMPQLLSVLRWTVRRTQKMAVKATMGLGAAALFEGLLALPWDGWLRLAVLNAVALLAVLTILPRKQRLLDEMQRHAHDACPAPSA